MRTLAVALLSLATLCGGCRGPSDESLVETARLRFRRFRGTGDAVTIDDCHRSDLPAAEVPIFRTNFALEPEGPPKLGTCAVRVSFRDSPQKGEHETLSLSVQFVWLTIPKEWVHWKTLSLD
jgi:hypothetical protein